MFYTSLHSGLACCKPCNTTYYKEYFLDTFHFVHFVNTADYSEHAQASVCIRGSAEKFIGYKLCHSNETWHALNQPFPDTNCIASFQMNPHWINYSGLWKVLLETIRRRPGKLKKGVLFHQDNALGYKSVVAGRWKEPPWWLQWLLCSTAHGFQLVDHPPYSPSQFSTPSQKCL